jgi:hypothetical protein
MTNTDRFRRRPNSRIDVSGLDLLVFEPVSQDKFVKLTYTGGWSVLEINRNGMRRYTGILNDVGFQINHDDKVREVCEPTSN